ncbi:MAG TPA: Hsp20/alpha crystallin family protein [Gaiellaceae bacterium]|jgi:HSP20 family protein|nr:Hsp20/alpha crystallin family protein [Gaiellaceae bacterium]
MQLVRWNPFQELDVMERRMRRLFDEAGIVPAPLPAADVYETPGEYVLELEVPGFDEKELAIEVSDHTLTVKGERMEEKREEGKTFRLQERLAKQFERRFELPAEAETGKVAADFKAGVLTVHAPKAKTSEPHTVKIAAT